MGDEPNIIAEGLSVTGPGHSAVIDIAATFKALYGYTPAVIPPMPPSPPFVDDKGIPYNATLNPLTALGKPAYGNGPDQSDALGRGVFMPLTLSVNGVNYNFPFCVMGLRNKKIMKETPMVERGGTVIEEVGIGAWEISVKGFLIDPDNQFPDDQLKALMTLYKTGNYPTQSYSVQVRSVLTDLALNPNYNVVITDLDIPPKPKVIGVRDFAFTLVQDSILNLTVINLNAAIAPGVAV